MHSQETCLDHTLTQNQNFFSGGPDILLYIHNRRLCVAVSVMATLLHKDQMLEQRATNGRHEPPSLPASPPAHPLCPQPASPCACGLVAVAT